MGKIIKFPSNNGKPAKAGISAVTRALAALADQGLIQQGYLLVRTANGSTQQFDFGKGLV